VRQQVSRETGATYAICPSTCLDSDQLAARILVEKNRTFPVYFDRAPHVLRGAGRSHQSGARGTEHIGALVRVAGGV
jgi:hypothetical protein